MKRWWRQSEDGDRETERSAQGDRARTEAERQRDVLCVIERGIKIHLSLSRNQTQNLRGGKERRVGGAGGWGGRGIYRDRQIA